MNAVRSGLVFGVLVAFGALAASPAPAEAGKAHRGDRTRPTVTCPEDVTAEAGSAFGTRVYFSASATDDRDPSPTISYSHASGSLFPLGTTTVQVTATDWAGNFDKCTFLVTVQDTMAPFCPSDMTVEATSAAGATATFAVRDLADPSPTVVISHESGSTFPIGTTTVTATATDSVGNSTTCSFDVTVRDTTGPWVFPPNDVLVSADGADGTAVTFAARALDLVDPEPTITYSHASGNTFPVGTTTVTVTATDDAGNSSSSAFSVTVLPYDDDPTDSPFAGTYAWTWWSDPSAYSPWYDWTITIAGDGTITGSGLQWYKLVPVYDVGGSMQVSYYLLEDLPDGVSPTGDLTGLVSDDGILQAEGTYEEYDYMFGIFTMDLFLRGQASLDGSGNLVLTDPAGGQVVWYRQ